MRGGPRRIAVRLVSPGTRVGTHAPANSLAVSWANAPMRSATASSSAAAPLTMKPARRAPILKPWNPQGPGPQHVWRTREDLSELG
jgi:hypothetical protein